MIIASIVHYNETRDYSLVLAAIAAQVDHIIVLDNNSEPSAQKRLADILVQLGNKAELIISDKNLGCSGGHNLLIDRALAKVANEESWFVIFNLDSLIESGFVEQLMNVYRSIESRGVMVGGVGPAYVDPNFMASVAGGKIPSEVDTLITSGHLMRMDLLKKGYRFNEQFFVDYVDHEFCLRLGQDGFKFFQIPLVEMIHALGEQQSHSFLSGTVYTSNYGLFRLHDQFRGRFCLYKVFALKRPSWVLQDCYAALKYILKVLLFESDKSVKIIAICRGIANGLSLRYQPPICPR